MMDDSSEYSGGLVPSAPVEEDENALANNVLIRADIRIGKLPFGLWYGWGKAKSELCVEWTRDSSKAMGMDTLADAFNDSPIEFPVPKAISDFGLELTRVALAYDFHSNNFSFTIEANRYGSFTISTFPTEKGRAIKFLLQLQAQFMLSNLPVLGDGIGKDDCIALKQFWVVVSTGKNQADTDTSLQIGATFKFVLMGQRLEITLPPGAHPGLIGAEAAASSSIKWLDVNKDAGPLHLSRLGFEMGDGSVTLYMDAGVKLSVLLLEFLGLYLSIPLKAGKSVGYGLQGLAVTVARPPLYISGGLYIAEEEGVQMYSGELSIKFNRLQVTALGSYGQFSDGTASLFIFLMLGYPFGGPPAFFVTGLAGGFGYNRGITLPAKVQQVGEFPFVAAAMGKGELKPGMSPAQVLVKMNQYIKPRKGQYFVSAGLRFMSFGILECFLLLNIQFGSRFEISLLGICTLSLPPQAPYPMAYAELALKAVIAPDDGLVSVEGALTSESYVLYKDCKLRGGFAFFTWFGNNPHAGDFVITLGGYRPGFNVPHYPSVDRLGVEWKISDNLVMTAGFYFALTPACVMMGGNLSLTYEWGRLKAWFRAWADFYMQWKPFAYEISVGVSVGASYDWDFFPFYTTFTVELGASLDLYGPPFGGRVHVSWFIISFTVSFGADRPNPSPIEWGDFTGTFLNAPAKGLGDDTPRDLIGIRPVSGVLRPLKEGETPLLDAEHLKIEVTTRMPCTLVKLAGEKVTGYDDLGILPMAVDSFSSILSVEAAPVKVWGDSGPGKGLQGQALCSNLPKALWNKERPNPNDPVTMKDQVPTGLTLYCQPLDPEGVLPVSGTYDMEVLCRNEHLKPHTYEWSTPAAIQPKEYPKDDRLRQIEQSIGLTGGLRCNMLSELADEFGIYRETDLKLDNWTAHLDEILLAVPELQRIGAGV